MLSPSDHNAVECYHKAAKAGHADAQYNLALFYEEGAGRYKIFVYWLFVSSRPGHKILSKFQVQGQVAIFIVMTRTKYFCSLKNTSSSKNL